MARVMEVDAFGFSAVGSEILDFCENDIFVNLLS